MTGSHIALSLALIALETALAFWVRALAARDGRSLADLVGRRPGLADVVIAGVMWVAWVGVLRLLDAWVPRSTSEVVGAMLPVGGVEAALWVLLALAAGSAEELAFRGYLLQKIGVVGQALVFGILHAYQGLASMVRITVYGLMFGVVARRRRSLVPGMLAHAWTDIAAGLFRW